MFSNIASIFFFHFSLSSFFLSTLHLLYSRTIWINSMTKITSIFDWKTHEFHVFIIYFFSFCSSQLIIESESPNIANFFSFCFTIDLPFISMAFSYSYAWRWRFFDRWIANVSINKLRQLRKRKRVAGVRVFVPFFFLMYSCF